MQLRPDKIWRYVFKEVLGPVLLGLMVYVLVFLMNALFDLAELAIKKDIPISVVARLLLYLMPRVLEMTLPMAALLGILMGVGRLSSDSEVIALRASGVSYRRIFMPVLFLALICWGASSLLILRVEPWARYEQRRLYSEQLYSVDLRREIKPRVFFEQIPGIILYADEVHQDGAFLDLVFLHQVDQDGREIVTLGHRAQIDYDRETGRTEFFLESGTNHTMTPDEPESYQISRFERQRFVREPDEAFKMKVDILSRPAPKNFSEQDLGELADSVRKADAITHKETRDRVVGTILVSMHERFALPFACIAFAFIGVPLGIANRRGGKASGFSLSVGIAIAYWVIYTFGQNMVREGGLSPYVGMWAANILLTVLGTLLLIMRERSEGLEISALIPERLRTLGVRLSGRPGASRVGADSKERPDGLGVDTYGTRSTGWYRLTGAMALILLGGLSAAYVTPFMAVGLILLALIFLFSTTLDRHILERFLAVLGGCLVSFFTLVAVYQFIQLFEDIIKRGHSVSLAIMYLGYRVPWIFSQVLPMSCLMACLLTFGIMSRFNEVTAAKASGTSIYRLAIPVLIVTFAISVLGYVNYDYLMPFSNRKAMQLKDTIQGRSPRSYRAGDRRWVFGEGGRLYTFRSYVPAPAPVLPSAGAGTFEGFSIYELDPTSFQMRSRTSAKSAAREGGRWVLHDGWTREFRSDGEFFERFAVRTADYPEGPDYFIKEWKTPEQMNFTELRKLVGNLARRGYATQELTVDLYGKTSYPLVPLTLVIIALPFCFRIGKKGSLYGVGIAIVLAATYFLTFSATSALGSAGVMPAFLAAWAPNILFAGVGTYLLLRTTT